MQEIIALLPFYLLGNLHCIGMCGPLVAFLGKHPFRGAYFIGRITGFTLAGVLASEVGVIINLISSHLHLSHFLTLGVALIFFALSLMVFVNFKLKENKLIKLMRFISLKCSQLALKERFSSLFLFGFLTILLPCGQSLLLFSFSALMENPLLGGINGGLFAILTTPSLFFAMKAGKWMASIKKYYKPLLSFYLFFVALTIGLRGLADLDVIDHLVILEHPHIVLY